MFKDFEVLGSSSPVESDWISLGNFSTSNIMTIQEFSIKDPHFVKYIKFIFKNHYPNEPYFCTISNIKVHGSTLSEQLDKQIQEDTQKLEMLQKGIDSKKQNNTSTNKNNITVQDSSGGERRINILHLAEQVKDLQLDVTLVNSYIEELRLFISKKSNYIQKDEVSEVRGLLNKYSKTNNLRLAKIEYDLASIIEELRRKPTAIPSNDNTRFVIYFGIFTFLASLSANYVLGKYLYIQKPEVVIETPVESVTPKKSPRTPRTPRSRKNRKRNRNNLRNSTANIPRKLNFG
eukprot:TRINITY_DN6576_c0_g1_i2.p1 TRINITY_DN6576_c0_g1~~TRINITY_DN6576_c0_g1_i2.p1  ORF type:complete len:290 (-),score=57.73 TRINITY_DN6576_c0_g1_i2:171-1040(-)